MLDIHEHLLCPCCFKEQLEFSSKNDRFVCPYCGYDERKTHNDEKAPGNSLAMGNVLLSRYIIGKTLGHGGFGITYIAYDIETDDIKAIKEYFPAIARRVPGGFAVQAQSASLQERFDAGIETFYDEAKIITRFEHNPGIVNVYDFFYENNTAYYVMEHIDGVDLKTWVKDNGPMGYDRAISVLVQMVYLLHDIHSQNILHGDISPDNIFISQDGVSMGVIKLLDFGASRRLYQTDGATDLHIKKGFTPKELYAKHVPGPWCDIYSLGATLYSLLTGKAPVESILRADTAPSESKSSGEDTLMRERIKWPSQMGVRIPNSFEFILQKMLAIDYHERYQSVSELRQDLFVITNRTQPADTLAVKPAHMRKGFVTVAIALAIAGFIGLTQVVVEYYDSIYREPVTLESPTSSSQSGVRPEGFRYILTPPSPEIIIVTIMPQMSDDPNAYAQGNPARDEPPVAGENIPEEDEGTPEDRARENEQG
ncbi:MAG: serine/threonine protein kinase [Clostridiales bacterium]|nr:serine/threonine protein kinase [Clostridiales bacterium]